MYRLARCLFDLNRSIEADKVLKSFQQKFPEYASNSACRALKMDIKEAIDTGNISILSFLYVKILKFINTQYVSKISELSLKLTL